MSIVDNERPPYVTFEMRGVEDRNASIAAGHAVEKEVAYAIITRPGSRDSLDKEAVQWLSEMAAKGKKGEIPASWYPAFKQSFDSWEKGETGAVSGTPIKGWTGLGAAGQKTVLAAGIFTVEDLANVPDAELQNLGTGAQSFKQKARAYLEAANGPGKAAEQLAAMSVQIGELTTLVREQAAELTSLRGEPKKKF